MGDTEFYLQQIEFLEFRLEDAKNREMQQKAMYESMLKSLSQETSNSDNNEMLLKMQQEHKLNQESLEYEYKEKINTLQQSLSQFESQYESLKLETSSQKSNFDRKLSFLDLELKTKHSQLIEKDLKLSSLELLLSQKDKEIKILRKTIEDQSSTHSEELLKIQSENNTKLETLKSIYDTEKLVLQSHISRLEIENSSHSSKDHLSDIVLGIENSSSRLDELTKSIEKIRSDCLESFTSIINSTETHINTISDLPLKDRLDLTEKMLRHFSFTQDNFAKIKKTVNSLRKVLDKKEEKEKNLKEAIQRKDEEIERFQRAVSIAAEQTKGRNGKLIEDLVRKETEIISLKRIVGELRQGDGKNKPPAWVPQHKRARTMSAHSSPFKFLGKIQVTPLDLTNINTFYSPTESKDPATQTTASTTRASDEKLEIYKKKINALEIKLAKMKNQRDRAKNLSEKLLFELKQRKLDLAILQENFAEQKHNFYSQVKGLTCYLSNICNSPLLPKILKQDLGKILESLYQMFN
ncbi:hypothetical protein SteCoe_23030 [Stentor coeruleus]|uniref:Uncharacterized protein n=1 Tax=Stentor coeruleus TaxID=5963 RepID=A0A1R2BLG8_9CILI|nr:hypothetical protein SteCoe_23030 [Stentor coeruleus]